ncbi:MAG: ABC transporter permease [Actinomycetota bacterium]|nr:ABC transporter permease [Actinomycetota bacterium]MDA8075060.1 ABC transporter permease [Actinomycetota bacterium]
MSTTQLPTSEQAPPGGATAGHRGAGALSRLLESRVVVQYGLLPVVLVGVLIAGEILAPGVLSPSNLSSMTRFGVEIGILGFAEMVVIIMGGGGIDLSVASTAAVTQVSLAVLLRGGIELWLGVAISLAIGLALGALNGFFILGLGVPALVATIGTYFGYAGLALVIANGVNIADFPSSYLTIGQGDVVGIPVEFIFIFIPVAIVLGYVTSRTKFGHEIRLTGTNERAALLSGINVRRLRFSGYVIAGMLAAIVGVVESSRFGTAQPVADSTYLLTAVTIAVLGGVDIFGGEGTILGVVLATAVVTIFEYAFSLAQINAVIELGSVGVMLIVVVLGQVGLKSLRSYAARRSSA